MNDLHEWMADWGVPAAALPDLLRRLGALDAPLSTGTGSEQRQQGLIRLEAARRGILLWRNNVGALLDQRGVPVRYGLANDTKAMNERVKSADLIGLAPGGQFVSLECKHEGWRWRGDAHEQAQLRWALIVQAGGGDARFVTSPDQL